MSYEQKKLKITISILSLVSNIIFTRNAIRCLKFVGTTATVVCVHKGYKWLESGDAIEAAKNLLINPNLAFLRNLFTSHTSQILQMFKARGIGVQISDAERIPKNGSFVVVANHPTTLDGSIILATLAFGGRQDVYLLSKRYPDHNDEYPYYERRLFVVSNGKLTEGTQEKYKN